jgi:prepilin-type N-terminal cleavage/methylation domain-containing protein/prepilin-type processing-associated H-X9-DG protein
MRNINSHCPSSTKDSDVSSKRAGFTLVELLVVVGIIALLISMLMPAIASSRRQAISVACRANLKTNYAFMLMYANDNKGWYAPPGFGYSPKVKQEDRWPSKVFTPHVWNPPTMKCPADFEPFADHSYILNDHVLQRQIRFGKTGQAGLSQSDVILMGEKKTTELDYYMEYKVDPKTGVAMNGGGEFWRLVEKYRHGLQFGSNYLMCDGSVSAKAPHDAELGMDPWDPPPAPPTPPPAP